MLPRRTGPTHYNALQCGTYIVYTCMHYTGWISYPIQCIHGSGYTYLTSWKTLHRVTLKKIKLVALKNATNILYRSSHTLCTNYSNRSMKRKTKSSFYEMCTISTTLQWWIGAHCTSYASPPLRWQVSHASAGSAQF